MRQQIVGVAESRLQDSLAVRKGEADDLRTVDDVEEAEKQIADFAKGYPGTENAKHLTLGLLHSTANKRNKLSNGWA